MARETNKLKPIDEPLFGYWRALFMSFYSKKLYIDVGKRWKGFGLLYLLLLVSLWAIPFAIKMIIGFNDVYYRQLTQPLSSIPKIYIQNGEVVFDKPMPYIIKNHLDEVVLIVDTTNKITTFSKEYPDLTVLINKDKISLRMPKLHFLGSDQSGENPNKPIVQQFIAGENFVFDGKRIVNQAEFTRWKIIIQVMIYPIVTVIFMGLFSVLFLVFGFLGQLFSNIFFSFQLTVVQSIRVLMVASTPVMLVLMGLLLFHKVFPGYGFYLVALLAMYFSFGVYSLKSESMRMVKT
ncbi:MAG: hypothetical protein CK426_05110 [Legionella sp.]|nr:MAG: hypothetical protein CK423_01600 [Legionella sp.]PJD98738.1 MAG: hypothetical protein CK426_05110 [Legionella sp.]